MDVADAGGSGGRAGAADPAGRILGLEAWPLARLAAGDGGGGDEGGGANSPAPDLAAGRDLGLAPERDPPEAGEPGPLHRLPPPACVVGGHLAVAGPGGVRGYALGRLVSLSRGGAAVRPDWAVRVPGVRALCAGPGGCLYALCAGPVALYALFPGAGECGPGRAGASADAKAGATTSAIRPCPAPGAAVPLLEAPAGTGAGPGARICAAGGRLYFSGAEDAPCFTVALGGAGLDVGVSGTGVSGARAEAPAGTPADDDPLAGFFSDPSEPSEPADPASAPGLPRLRLSALRSLGPGSPYASEDGSVVALARGGEVSLRAAGEPGRVLGRLTVPGRALLCEGFGLEVPVLLGAGAAGRGHAGAPAVFETELERAFAGALDGPPGGSPGPSGDSPGALPGSSASPAPGGTLALLDLLTGRLAPLCAAPPAPGAPLPLRSACLWGDALLLQCGSFSPCRAQALVGRLAALRRALPLGPGAAGAATLGSAGCAGALAAAATAPSALLATVHTAQAAHATHATALTTPPPLISAREAYRACRAGGFLEALRRELAAARGPAALRRARQQVSDLVHERAARAGQALIGSPEERLRLAAALERRLFRELGAPAPARAAPEPAPGRGERRARAPSPPSEPAPGAPAPDPPGFTPPPDPGPPRAPLPDPRAARADPWLPRPQGPWGGAEPAAALPLGGACAVLRAGLGGARYFLLVSGEGARALPV